MGLGVSDMAQKYFYDVKLISKNGRGRFLYKDLTGLEVRKLRKELREKYLFTDKKIGIYKRYFKKGKEISEKYDIIKTDLIDDIISILSKSEYSIDYTYNYMRDCSSNYCDSICRCGWYEDIQIENIPLGSIISSFMSSIMCVIFHNITTKSKEDLEIIEYCIERLLRLSNLDSKDAWDVKVSNGYYGEEIDGAFLYSNIVKNLAEEINNIIRIKPIDAVKYVLIKEYSYLTEGLSNCSKCKVAITTTNKIELPNKDYVKKLSKKIVEQYAGHKLPIAVCVGHKLVDGYHRYVAASGEVKIISLS